MLNLHHAQLSFQVAWGALGKQLVVRASIQYHALMVSYCIPLGILMHTVM